jgi:magnesium-transporting ATPase (P-type)
MKEVLLASAIGMFIIYEFILFIRTKSYVNLMSFDLKKDAEKYKDNPDKNGAIEDLVHMFLILAATVFSIFSNKAMKKLLIATITLFYLVFLMYGAIYSYYWYIYASILLLGIVNGFIAKYLNKNKNWIALVYHKKADSLITIGLFIWLIISYYNL